jgi:hypothetical protein
MESDQKRAARDKVVSKACTWADSRQNKAAAKGGDKASAQFKHKKDGDELAEAVEKYQKAE